MRELLTQHKNARAMGCYTSIFSKHKTKCRKMFRDIENGAQLYINVERIISENEFKETFINEISSEDTQHVRISILTDEIIEYDLETFSIGDNLMSLNSYRPYFVSFVVELDRQTLKQINSLGDKWYMAQFVQSDRYVEDGTLLLDGILEMSASPVNYLDGRLLVFTNRAMKKDVLDKINSTYDPKRFSFTSNSKIEKILNDAWLKDRPKTIDIYNVGHGNADYIRGNHHRLLYDIGYNYRSFPSRYNYRYFRAIDAIRRIKPNCVILSHWDMDHIIGCAYAKQDVFSVKWIAPYLVSSKDKNATPNSIRLAHYLKTLGNLCLVDRDQKNQLIATISGSNGVELKLWLGSGTSKLTPKNREGLLIEIEDINNNCPHILLSGDVPYKCMPNILNKQIDFMHVPHHCSSMELDKLKSLPGTGQCAVISTNCKKDGTLNYDRDHHNELEIKFENVINTIDSVSGNDEENLSVEINCRRWTYRFR